MSSEFRKLGLPDTQFPDRHPRFALKIGMALQAAPDTSNTETLFTVTSDMTTAYYNTNSRIESGNEFHMRAAALFDLKCQIRILPTSRRWAQNVGPSAVTWALKAVISRALLCRSMAAKRSGPSPIHSWNSPSAIRSLRSDTDTP